MFLSLLLGLTPVPAALDPPVLLSPPWSTTSLEDALTPPTTISLSNPMFLPALLTLAFLLIGATGVLSHGQITSHEIRAVRPPFSREMETIYPLELTLEAR